MGEVLEVVKVLISPTEKLINAVQSAIGKAYEPRYIRKIADAKAYEVKQIGQAMRESSDIPINYNKGDIVMDTTEFDDFVKRTQNRLAYQELTKQNNIESIVDKAYIELENKTEISNEPVNVDWLYSFFDFVANVSNEQMQEIWGKILAGEVEHPGRFSIRTLDALRKLSQNEAIMFEKTIPYILKCWGDESKTYKDYFLIRDCKNLDLFDIIKLSEAGLFVSNTLISAGITVEPGEKECIENINYKIEFHNIGEKSVKISKIAYFLTEAGKELYNALCNDEVVSPTNYLEECKKEFLKTGGLLGALKEEEKESMIVNVVKL